MRLAGLVLTLLLVSLAPAFAGTGGAAPGTEDSMSLAPGSHSGNGILERAWGFISCFWTGAGCSIDPLGAPANKAGCSLDPLGTPCNKAGLDFDPLGVAPPPTTTVEAGCDVDLIGGCRAFPQP